MSQSFNSLDLSQKRTLNAWKIALQRVNIEEFPEALKLKIEQIEAKLSENNYQVLDEILNVVQENTHLNNAYQTARTELAEDYNSKQRDKTAVPLEEVNIARPNYRIDNAREKTKQKLNRKALLILQALDSYPLTLEDLKYRLNLPSGEVHKLIKQLWNERKISKLSRNIWYTLLPITNPGELNIKNDDSDIYFTVTSLGKMQLSDLRNSR